MWPFPPFRFPPFPAYLESWCEGYCPWLVEKKELEIIIPIVREWVRCRFCPAIDWATGSPDGSEMVGPEMVGMTIQKHGYDKRKVQTACHNRVFIWSFPQFPPFPAYLDLSEGEALYCVKEWGIYERCEVCEMWEICDELGWEWEWGWGRASGERLYEWFRGWISVWRINERGQDGCVCDR